MIVIFFIRWKIKVLSYCFFVVMGFVWFVWCGLFLGKFINWRLWDYFWIYNGKVMFFFVLVMFNWIWKWKFKMRMRFMSYSLVVILGLVGCD